MRIYVDPVEMVKEVERDLFEMGTRVQSATMQDKDVHDDPQYQTVELFGYGYTLTSFNEDSLAAMVAHTGGNLTWARAELADRLKPEYINPGDAWKIKSGLWKEYIRDGRFAYTYNERWREQLPAVIEEINRRPATRQAIVTMYDRHQDMNNWGGKDRVPCSMHYQMAARDGKLSMIYVMRSCDFLVHFVHDVYFAIGMLRHVAKHTGLEVGNFTHFLGSLHAYAKDMEERGIF